MISITLLHLSAHWSRAGCYQSAEVNHQHLAWLSQADLCRDMQRLSLFQQRKLDLVSVPEPTPIKIDVRAIVRSRSPLISAPLTGRRAVGVTQNMTRFLGERSSEVFRVSFFIIGFNKFKMSRKTLHTSAGGPHWKDKLSISYFLFPFLFWIQDLALLWNSFFSFKPHTHWDSSGFGVFEMLRLVCNHRGLVHS